MVNGIQPSALYILPMLGKRHDEYPRFRDCFVGKLFTDSEKDQFGIPVIKHGEEEMISVYTRVGGDNREGYIKEINEMRAMPEYIEDFDDDFDETFATFVFRVPEQFKADFHLVNEGKLNETSQAYRDIMYKVYPGFKEKLEELFKKES